MSPKQTETPKQTPEEKKEAAFWATLEKKATEFTDKTTDKRKVLPFSLPGKESGTHVIGYMYDMDDETYDKLTWAKLMGDGKNSLALAKESLEKLMWWHESDPAMRNRENMNGAAMFLLGEVKIVVPEFKKK